MGHAVHYRTTSGETRLEEAASLEEALAKVERIRNEGGVSDVRVYREVPIAFQTYYKVTVADDEGQQSAEAPAPAAVTPPAGAMPLNPAVPHPAAVPQGDGLEPGSEDHADEAKRSSLFSRSG